MLNILFPKLCHGCDAKLIRSEKVLCNTCRHKLPILGHHSTGDNSMRSIFSGRTPIVNATALLQFHKKGITQRLIHDLKYRKQEAISYFLGRWLGSELSETIAYAQIDVVVPVPIHKKKKRERGYNQVSGFGLEIAKALAVPFEEDVLYKVSATKTKVFKKRLTRFDDDKTFDCTNSSKIKDKHVLLVDDIVTTGATLEVCANALLKSGAKEISLATMAITV